MISYKNHYFSVFNEKPRKKLHLSILLLLALS